MLRIVFQLLSMLLHPLMMMSYVLGLLFWVNPLLFGSMDALSAQILFITILASTFLIPGVAILMMKTLGLIPSLHMPDRRDRIAPLIACGIFYIWIFRNMLDNPTVPDAYRIFSLGVCITLSLCFFINLFNKISLHAAGMGGVWMMSILIYLLFSPDELPLLAGSSYTIMAGPLVPVLIATLTAGLVGSARLYLKAHTPQELAGGYFMGIAGVLIAFFILYP